MGKDELKKNNPTVSDTKKVKQKAKEMQEKGITSEAKAGVFRITWYFSI